MSRKVDPNEKFWHKRIRLARRRYGFTPEDKKAAGRWTDCACGKQDPALPRAVYLKHMGERRLIAGEPIDHRLSKLGMAFMYAVKEDRIDEAAAIIEQIDVRSGLILAQEKVKDQLRKLEGEASALRNALAIDDREEIPWRFEHAE